MIGAWIVMMCLIDCDNDIAAARRDGFSYEQAIRRDGTDMTLGTWSTDISSEKRRHAVESLRDRQFPTQRSCMAALKRALPVMNFGPSEGPALRGGVEHHRDYVLESLWTSWNQSQYFACYHREPVVG